MATPSLKTLQATRGRPGRAISANALRDAREREGGVRRNVERQTYGAGRDAVIDDRRQLRGGHPRADHPERDEPGIGGRFGKQVVVALAGVGVQAAQARDRCAAHACLGNLGGQLREPHRLRADGEPSDERVGVYDHVVSPERSESGQPSILPASSGVNFPNGRVGLRAAGPVV